MRIYLGLIALIGAFFVMVSPATYPTTAQSDDCAAIVQETISDLHASCSNIAGNSVCFGRATSVEALDASNTAPFAQAGDTLSLSNVQQVSTARLVTEGDQWGLAELTVHANVPLSVSGQGLRYILLGDVNLENTVPFDRAFIPSQPIKVAPLVGANLRSFPSTDGRVVASATVGQELLADGLSADQAWLRVLNDNTPVWISRQVVTTLEGSIEDLPTVGTDTRTLMQSFILKTGTEAAECAGAPPSMMVIQAPDGMTANITVNGIDVRLTCTIALRNLPDNALQLFVLGGGANTGGVSVPPGFTMTVSLDENGSNANGLWTGLRPITDQERQSLMPLEALQSSEPYCDLTIPTQADVAAILAQLNRAAGEQTVAGPASGNVKCAGFRPTSPIEGMPFGVVNFYWDRAEGASTYRLNIYENGALIRSVDVDGFNTTTTIDTSALGGGSNYTWDVQAFYEGQLACTTGQINVVRAAGSVPVGDSNNNAQPQAQPTACLWGNC